MKQVLAQIKDVVESLEAKGQIVEAARLNDVFVRVAQFEAIGPIAQYYGPFANLPQFFAANKRSNGEPARLINNKIQPLAQFWQGVQGALGIATDGVPGPNTFNALNNFVKKYGNKADAMLAQRVKSFGPAPAPKMPEPTGTTGP